MKRKRPGIMLTADELDIVRRAIDLGREVIGDWLEDKLCSVADKRFGQQQLRDFARLELKMSGCAPPAVQTGYRIILFSANQEGSNGAA